MRTSEVHEHNSVSILKKRFKKRKRKNEDKASTNQPSNDHAPVHQVEHNHTARAGRSNKTNKKKCRRQFYAWGCTFTRTDKVSAGSRCDVDGSNPTLARSSTKTPGTGITFTLNAHPELFLFNVRASLANE